jgi:hypothetical protein
MLKVTTWSPDTCKCVIEYSWDSDNPQAEVQPHGIVKACEAHKGHDVTTHHTKILKENKDKNRAINKLCESFPALKKKDADGNDVPDLSKISFSHDANRKLKLSVKGLSNDKPANKNKAKSDIESVLGAGTVDVEAL